MKKVSRLIICILTAVLTVSACFIREVSADETLKATKVNVVVDVSEYNILTITETIDIEFATPHHGIIRDIPTENTIYREDGTTGHTSAEIYDVTCNQPYTTSYLGSELRVRIGDADKEVTGHIQYVLSYKYDLGNDILRGGDELYLNIIGTGWTYQIERLEVTINMPKEFDASKLGVSHGKMGSVDYSNVKQNVVGNTVYLLYEQTLEPEEAFTVRCLLPEGYFKKVINWQNILTGVIVSLIALVTGFVNKKIYNRFGKPDPVITPVEFYPPENMSPPRLYNVIYNYISNNSVNGLLITLAQKGYLTIDTPENGHYSFTLYDKPTDELCEEEKMYYDGLWERGHDQLDGTRVVTREDVEYKFHRTVSDIKNYIRKHSERVYVRGRFFFAAINEICGLLLLLFGPAYVLIRVTYWRFEWYHWAAIALCAITGVYLIVLSCKYKKRTERHNILYGRALGFRDFIDVADRERLEALVEENPMYFYDILPYAYALDMTSTWMSRFEGMLMEPAEWYHGDDLRYFMTSTFTDYSHDAVSYVSSDSSDSDSGFSSSDSWSSSSSSGGGSSGGGSGGGGSSGW